MMASYTVATSVPLPRVLREYRLWLLPLGAVIAVNLVVLVSVVLPLVRAVGGSDQQAQVSAQAVAAAEHELKAAEATRDGQAAATRDLERFYRQVLPGDAAAARRVTHLRLSQLAREHDLTFERSSASPESAKGSSLQRLKVGYGFSGSWSDIRQFIYDIETGSDFLIIDNVVLSQGTETSAPLSLTLELSTYYRAAVPAP